MALSSNFYRPENNPLAVNPAEYRHNVQVQQPSTTRDAAGQPVSTWDVVLSQNAKIDNTSSLAYKQSFQGNALATQSTDLISIRWPGPDINIKPGMRVLFGDNVFLVQAVDNVLRRNRIVRMACLLIDGDSN